MRKHRVQRFFKRCTDVVFSILLLLLSSPVLLLTFAVVRLTMGRPVFFLQRRCGLRGREFHVYKFRTMREAYDEEGKPLPDEQRTPWIGKAMRRLKFDELPQLVNVLVGSMSLVGPRPTLREQVERYDAFERQRLEVRPGMTGWAQINGNTKLTWPERIRLDVWYVRHWSLFLDFRILIRTLEVMIFGERIKPGIVDEIRSARRD